MAIKQITVGGTTHDLKALNASNQNQASAVVRDIQYGTSSPSGGTAGQVYLQYNTSTTSNPYVYAEDTIGNPSNASDIYYSKSEIQNLLSWKRYASVTGNNNFEITDIWNQATEFYIVVSKYFRGSQTSSNEVMELQCHILKEQLIEDLASSYNTGKIVFIPAGTRYNHNSGNSGNWSALFRIHEGAGPKYYVQLNELFCVSLTTGNQNAGGYYVIYWR